MLSTHRRQPASLICWDTCEVELVRCKEERSSLTMWSVVWIWSPDNICHNNEKSLRPRVWGNGIALVLPPFLSLCNDSRESRNVCLFPYCITSIQLMQYYGKEKKPCVIRSHFTHNSQLRLNSAAVTSTSHMTINFCNKATFSFLTSLCYSLSINCPNRFMFDCLALSLWHYFKCIGIFKR